MILTWHKTTNTFSQKVEIYEVSSFFAIFSVSLMKAKLEKGNTMKKLLLTTWSCGILGLGAALLYRKGYINGAADVNRTYINGLNKIFQEYDIEGKAKTIIAEGKYSK